MPSGDSPGFDATPFFSTCARPTFRGLAEETIFTFGFSIFAGHAAASCASVNFEVSELKEAGRREITHEVTMRPLTGNA